MYARSLRWALSLAVRGACTGSGGSGHWASAPRVLTRCRNSDPGLPWDPWWRSPFSTETEGAQPSPAPKAKKQHPRAHSTIGSVGRKIQKRLLLLISVDGENLGTMHRADVLKLMDEQGLKLVLLNDKADPPVYRLMSGKQIHEEQLKLREKQKAKAAPVQVKELTFSSDIATHDLSTKLKQVQSWLEKKNHVRVTLRSRRRESTASLDVTLEQMVHQMGVTPGFVSKPKVISDGQAAMCVLRPLSAKELLQKSKKESAAGQLTERAQTAPVSSANTSTEPEQQ